MRLCLLFLLLNPLLAAAQDYTGTWSGYISTAGNEVPFELVISSNQQGLTGYSLTVFVINGVENVGMKTVKIKTRKKGIGIEDDDLIYNNYSTAGKRVTLYGNLELSGADSNYVLEGSFFTRSLDRSSYKGTIRLKKNQRPASARSMPILANMNLWHDLSFLPASVVTAGVTVIPPGSIQKSVAKQTVKEVAVNAAPAPAATDGLQKGNAGKKEQSSAVEIATVNAAKKEQGSTVEIAKVNTAKKEESSSVEMEKGNAPKEEESSAAEIAKVNAMKKEQSSVVEIANANSVKKEEISAVEIAKVNAAKKEESSALGIAKVNAAKKEESSAVEIAKVNAVKKEEGSAVEIAKVNSVKKEEIRAVETAKVNAAKKEESLAVAMDKGNAPKKEEIRAVEIAKVNTAKKEQSSAVEITKGNAVKKEESRAMDIEKGNAAKKEESSAVEIAKVNAAKKEESSAVEKEKASAVKKAIEPPPPPKLPVMPPAAEFKARRTEVIRTIYYSSDSLSLGLYDNGEIDGDTVSVLVNDRVLLGRQGLTAVEKLTVLPVGDFAEDSIKLVLYAENLGKIAPNTGVLVIRDGEDRYYVRFEGDFQKNSAVILRRRK